MGRRVAVHDVTLRDGMMNQPPVPVDIKLSIVNLLAGCGIRKFEVIRFPLDGKYAQFDHGLELLEKLQDLRGHIEIAAFAMGQPGIDESIKFASLYDQLHIPSFVSDGYAQYAFGAWGWGDTVKQVQETQTRAEAAGIVLTLGLGTSFGCPITGPVQPARTVECINQLVSLGVKQVMVGDTAGTATPAVIDRTFAALAERARPQYMRVHFHNTFGRALLNSLHVASLGLVDGVDVSLMGLGGEPHPYFVQPDAVDNGNCATEEFLPLLAENSSRSEIESRLFPLCRDLAGYIEGYIPGRAAFAEFVPVEGIGSGAALDKVPQGSNRH